MRKRRNGATKCGLRAPTTAWVCQPKRQRLNCRYCVRESSSGDRSRVRLRSVGDRSHKSGAARRYANGRYRNEATALETNSSAAFRTHASHTRT
ncbi:MAG: hypothetical protein AAB308_01940 [Nitrospirota bacterium]